jgi:hypothetical protein
MEAVTTSLGRERNLLLLECIELLESRLSRRLFLLREIFFAEEIAHDLLYVAVLAVDGVI